MLFFRFDHNPMSLISFKSHFRFDLGMDLKGEKKKQNSRIWKGIREMAEIIRKGAKGLDRE